MKLNGSEDIRIQKTITAIHNSFCEMICEMDYEKITVKELCQRARINKKTFYVYYETLDSLLREVQKSYYDQYIELLKPYQFPNDADELIRIFFTFSTAQDEAYEKITIAASYRGIRNEMLNQVMIQSTGHGYPHLQLGISDFAKVIQYRFLSETCLMIYEEWINEKKKTSIENVIGIAQKLILNGMH